jgi:hypothetical protein
MRYSEVLAEGAKALFSSATTRTAATKTCEIAAKTCEIVARTRKASSKAREDARRTAETMREFVLTFMSHRFRPISGASDRDENAVSSPLLPYIWIANSSGDTRCAGCGHAILVGDPIWEISVDGRASDFGPACGKRYMEHLRNEHAEQLPTC